MLFIIVCDLNQIVSIFIFHSTDTSNHRQSTLLKIPLNQSIGDISSVEDVDFAKCVGCAGVMLGRNAMGNPEIFSNLKGINPPYSKKEAIKKHLELLKTYFRNEKTLVAYFKKHLMWYVKSTNCATATKLKILEL